MADHQVFISYAWGGESEVVANEIEAELSSQGILVIRDKTYLGFKGLIREFMEKIGQGNLVVVIISDKYLKSENCMFELLEVEKRGEFYNRVFPVILTDAQIYEPIGIINYLKYWDQKIKLINSNVKELDSLADTRMVQEYINRFTDIRGAIDSLAAKLSNMNTLTIEFMRANHFKPLIEGLQLQMDSNLSRLLTPSALKPATKKEGKVLYHIPGMMQVEKWTRCTVRLAWDEILLSEGLKIPEEERVVESIRMGNVMQVSLSESRSGRNFEIKELNNTEQFIFEDDFTDWLFDVKAKSEGNFTLILRVTLVQIIAGYERKKDIVLERNVKTEVEVPEALAMFEIAEDGLTGINNDDTSFLKKPKGKKYSKDYPEIFDDFSEPPVTRRVSNRASPPKSYQIPESPRKPRQQSKPAQEVNSRSFRKILPYAASVAALAVVGILFFSEIGNQTPSSEDDYIGSVENGAVSEEGYGGEKLLVALTLNATAPSGEQVNEVMLFMIGADQMDSLIFLDPENYSIQVFPSSETDKLASEQVLDFTILEIQDSITKASISPSMLDGQVIDKSQLQINPGTQIRSTIPQPLDSSTSQKLRMGTKKFREN